MINMYAVDFKSCILFTLDFVCNLAMSIIFLRTIVTREHWKAAEIIIDAPEVVI